MHRKNALFLAITIIFTLFSSYNSGFAQEEKKDEAILLKYQFQDGETITYLSRLKGMAMIDALGAKTGSSTDITFETISKIKILSQDTFQIESKKTGSRILIDGKIQKNPPDEINKTVLFSNGRISEGHGRKTGNPHQVKLPDNPVKIGDKWQFDEKLNFQVTTKELQNFEIRTIYTFEGIKNHKGKRCALISVKTGVRKPYTGDITVKISGTGEIYFELDKGRIITAVNVVKADLSINQPGKDGKSAQVIEIKSRNSSHLSLR